jgi:hypothetical protein
LQSGKPAASGGFVELLVEGERAIFCGRRKGNLRQPDDQERAPEKILILSTAAVILWLIALALRLRGGADRSSTEQPQHQANDQRA